ncbi:Rare lipoprotein A [Methylorubrum extorquens]|uniref:Rare lipoprotein A n=1 Tax=Methylorubrum extorquens TaxID=408 RepID=A0A2N9AQZ3_METEX|nr:Rare lipoprotein A [Methylorubrum extorquens]
MPGPIMLLQRLAVRAALACLVLSVTPARAEWTGTASFYGHESGSHRADGRRFVPRRLAPRTGPCLSALRCASPAFPPAGTSTCGSTTAARTPVSAA